MTPTRVNLNPAKPLNPFVIYRQMGWSPHEGQRQIVRTTSRNRVVSAGRRFGKSQVGGHRLAVEALNTRLVKTFLDDIGKRREFWIVGPSYSDSEKEFRVAWDALVRAGFKDYFDKPGSYNNPQVGEMQISLWGGKFMLAAKSEQRADSLVGEGLSGVIMAEAAKLKERTWIKLVRPTLADFNGWADFTSTPEGKNWFYRLWKRGQDPNRPDWASFRMPSWTNPHVYPEGATDDGITLLRRALDAGAMATPELFREFEVDPEIAAMVGDLTEEAFNQEIGAEFTQFVGRVFKEFDEEVHVGDYPFEPSWSTYAAVDYGFTNPSVWLLIQVDPFGEQVRVLDEVYQTGLTPEEFAATIKSKGLAPSSLRFFYPDPASPGDTRTLEQKLRLRHKGGTGGEIKWRVDAIRTWLKIHNKHLPEGQVDRFPKLVFDRKCERTIADMLNYKYPERKANQETNAQENPMKKDDHGPEALGRFFAGHFGTADKTTKRARNRKSNLAK